MPTIHIQTCGKVSSYINDDVLFPDTYPFPPYGVCFLNLIFWRHYSIEITETGMKSSAIVFWSEITPSHFCRRGQGFGFSFILVGQSYFFQMASEWVIGQRGLKQSKYGMRTPRNTPVVHLEQRWRIWGRMGVEHVEHLRKPK